MTRREQQRYARFGIPLSGLGDVATNYVNVGSRMTPNYVNVSPFANLTPVPGITNPGINPSAGYGIGWGDTAVLQQARPASPQPVVQAAATGVSPLVLIGAGAAVLALVFLLRG